MLCSLSQPPAGGAARRGMYIIIYTVLFTLHIIVACIYHSFYISVSFIRAGIGMYKYIVAPQGAALREAADCGALGGRASINEISKNNKTIK